MDLETLRKKLGKTLAKLERMDADGMLAAPVDVKAMFQHGVVEATGLKQEKKKGLVVTGDVSLEEWRIAAPTWVRGNVSARRIHVMSDLVVEGKLTVTEVVHGQNEPNVLTVLGAVTIARAICEGQFIMQFLGGGTIEELIDDEGGGEELIELLREGGSELKVKKIGDKLPK